MVAGRRQKALVVLVEACLRALPEILTGKRPATEVLFPDGSLHLVEGSTQGNAGADYFNGVLADTAAAYVRERLARDPAAEIRILEIGAGTGGTTAAVLAALAPFKEHHPGILLHGPFQSLPDARGGTLCAGASLPDDPALRRFTPHRRPGHRRGPLRPGHRGQCPARHQKHPPDPAQCQGRPSRKTACILLNELYGTPLVVHLTFGLLEGWWLYDDPALRLPGNPGLSPHTWQRVLEEEGLRSVWFPAESAHDLGQQVIVAESDGVVRQGRAVPAGRRAWAVPPCRPQRHLRSGTGGIEPGSADVGGPGDRHHSSMPVPIPEDLRRQYRSPQALLRLRPGLHPRRRFRQTPQ